MKKIECSYRMHGVSTFFFYIFVMYYSCFYTLLPRKSTYNFTLSLLVDVIHFYGSKPLQDKSFVHFSTVSFTAHNLVYGLLYILCSEF